MSRPSATVLLATGLMLGFPVGYLMPHHATATPVPRPIMSNQMSDQALLETIMAHEYAVVERLKRNDIDAFARMLPDDIVDSEDDGIHRKADWLATFRVQKDAGYLFHEFHFIKPELIRINADAAVYYASESWRATAHGKPSNGCVYTQALYIRRGNAWVPRLYQDTPASAPHACGD